MTSSVLPRVIVLTVGMFAVANGGTPSVCSSLHCPLQLLSCMMQDQCRDALMCNARCQHQTDVVGCNLLCQFNYGYKDELYINMLQCMQENDCLPVLPMSGKCLKTNKTVSSITDYEQIKGRWWIVRGLNCGQEGWTGGFDAFPCQYDDFVEEDGTWMDHIGYCGGRDSVCSSPYINTVARAEITEPGVLSHYYLDAPLLPQVEEWYILSRPHPDWMLYTYCGSTPTGPYGGGSVVTRSGLKPSDIPDWIEREFIAVAAEHGFDYHDMCLSDNTDCPGADPSVPMG